MNGYSNNTPHPGWPGVNGINGVNGQMPYTQQHSNILNQEQYLGLNINNFKRKDIFTPDLSGVLKKKKKKIKNKIPLPQINSTNLDTVNSKNVTSSSELPKPNIMDQIQSHNGLDFVSNFNPMSSSQNSSGKPYFLHDKSPDASINTQETSNLSSDNTAEKENQSNPNIQNQSSESQHGFCSSESIDDAINAVIERERVYEEYRLEFGEKHPDIESEPESLSETDDNSTGSTISMMSQTASTTTSAGMSSTILTTCSSTPLNYVKMSTTASSINSSGYNGPTGDYARPNGSIKSNPEDVSLNHVHMSAMTNSINSNGYNGPTGDFARPNGSIKSNPDDVFSEIEQALSDLEKADAAEGKAKLCDAKLESCYPGFDDLTFRDGLGNDFDLQSETKAEAVDWVQEHVSKLKSIVTETSETSDDLTDRLKNNVKLEIPKCNCRGPECKPYT